MASPWIAIHGLLTEIRRLYRYRKELLEAVGEANLDFSGYCRLAAQTMLQSAMEIEVGEFVGRASSSGGQRIADWAGSRLLPFAFLLGRWTR